MSEITLVLVKHGMMRVVRGHYRELKTILTELEGAGVDVVDGYVFVDLDNNRVFNCQHLVDIRPVLSGICHTPLNIWEV